MKLLDISNTVERATANGAELGVDFLTIHGQELKTIQAAVAGRGKSSMRLLAVTVLTHLSRSDLKDHLLDLEPSDLVMHRAKPAAQGGCDGIVASALEVERFRQELGQKIVMVTPGIRLEGGEAGDQARVTTPFSAIQAGADYLVVGRPITQAPDPKAAAQEVTRQIQAAIKLAQPS